MMRAIKLDFVHRPNPCRQWAYFLLLCSAVAAIYLAQSYVALTDELAAWETKWRSLQNSQRKEADLGSGKKPDWEQLQTELKAANRVITRLSMPWDALFREVDASINDQVTLLSVEPDAEKRELHITAEARNLAGMLDYLRHLRTIALFKDAYVASHQSQEQDPQKPVRFVVNAQWLDTTKTAVDTQDKLFGMQN